MVTFEFILAIKFEPVHEISNNVVCATNNAFAYRLSILWLFSYRLDTIWSFLA